MRARSRADDPFSTEARIMSSPVLFEAIPPPYRSHRHLGVTSVSRRLDEVAQLSGGLYVELRAQELLMMLSSRKAFD